MKFGTSTRFLFPTSAATHETFKGMLSRAPAGSFIERPLGAYATATQAKNLLEIATAASAARLDSFLVGDNHAVGASYANCFQPIPSLARVMANTGDMQVGMVLLAAFYHPILLAEQIGTIAAYHHKPIIVTLANGGNVNAFNAFGMNVKSRAARLEELIAATRRLLSGERVTHHGRFFQFENVQISPIPVQPVQVWVAGTVDASTERAGRLGDGWLTAQNTPAEGLVHQLALYKEACRTAGREPFPVLRRDIFVAATDAEAHAVVDPVLAEGYRGSGTDELLIGSPETVVEQIRRWHALGFSYLSVRHIPGDHEGMVESFRLIGEKVIPAIRDWR